VSQPENVSTRTGLVIAAAASAVTLAAAVTIGSLVGYPGAGRTPDAPPEAAPAVTAEPPAAAPAVAGETAVAEAPRRHDERGERGEYGETAVAEAPRRHDEGGEHRERGERRGRRHHEDRDHGR
jgi:hypothetical protein